jgi:hypothetical protein
VYIACGAAIDATGKGYVNGATYPGEQVQGNWTGGSHIGRGGLYNGVYGSTYGSVVRPRELGASTLPSAFGPGGGAVRIVANSVVVDGAIRANGAQHSHSGAGGSIWITTSHIAGRGTIETNGGPGQWGIGGGGALAIEYTDPASVLPALSSRTGANIGESRYGGAGSIYVKGPTSVYGDLTIDNGGINKEPTILPSLGKGVAQSGTSGATLVTDRANDIQAFYVGHWVEITAPDGTPKGTWRIGTIDAAKTVTLTPNDAEAIDIDPGDAWQGVYRFDNVKAVGIRVDSADPIRVTGTQTIEGTVETDQVTAGTLVVRGTLTHAPSQSLSIDADEVIVDAGGAIDVTGKGYGNGAIYPSEQSQGDWTGASHIGRGGLYNGVYGSTYGSIYRPQERGASTHPAPSGPGGGVLRIVANSVVVNGAIRANGAQHSHSGAGGSVWITTGRISGTGTIQTNGGAGQWGRRCAGNRVHRSGQYVTDAVLAHGSEHRRESLRRRGLDLREGTDLGLRRLDDRQRRNQQGTDHPAFARQGNRAERHERRDTGDGSRDEHPGLLRRTLGRDHCPGRHVEGHVAHRHHRCRKDRHAHTQRCGGDRDRSGRHVAGRVPLRQCEGGGDPRGQRRSHSRDGNADHRGNGRD